MVPVKTYKSYWDDLGTGLSIDRVLMVSDESELQQQIKDVALGEKILVAVIPSSDTEAPDVDNIEEVDSCFVFILQKVSFQDIMRDELLDVQQFTQELISSVKEQMTEDFANVNTDTPGSKLMRRLVIDKMHTDPEYNYLGCTGWSLSFQLKSIGFNHD